MSGVAGRIHSDLMGAHSKQSPIIGFSDEVVITGSVEVELGAFGSGRTNRDFANGTTNQVKQGVVASLGQAPVAGAAFVTVTDGSTASTKTISVYDDAYVLSVIPTKVNLVSAQGTPVGQ